MLENMFTRRQVVRAGLVLPSAYLLSELLGCFTSTDPKQTPTGVPGLQTPEQIKSNPEVSEGIAELRDAIRGEGLSYEPRFYGNDAINPPGVEGKYKHTGMRLFPSSGQLYPGTQVLNNQNEAKNTIDMSYSQTFQNGRGKGLTIIRGAGGGFTIYGPMVVYDEGCGKNFDVMYILDGVRDSEGIAGAYAGCVLEGNCLVTSGGILDLPYIGPPKPRNNESRIILPEAEEIREYARTNIGNEKLVELIERSEN